jgi:hypothetical protein
VSWVDLLLDSRAIRSIFGDLVPTLDLVALHEVRLDRQAASLFLRFDLAEYPAVPPKKWVAQEANTVQVEIQFFEVRGVTIDGWGVERDSHIEILRNGEGLIEVTCGAIPTIAATAEFVALRKISAYKSELR